MMEAEDRTGSPHSTGSSPMIDSAPCFFADATLDLGEAHAIAETPEPKKTMVSASSSELLNVPSLQDTHTTDLMPSSQSIRRDDRPPLKLNRLTHKDHERHTSISNHQPTYRPKMPRRPRDIAWAMAFLLLIPVSLTPALYPRRHSDSGSTTTSDWYQVATAPPSRHATMYCIICALVVSQILNRLLYRTMGGGDGDDARHFVTQAMLICAPISVAMNPLLIVAIYLQTPHAIGFAVIPLFFLLRDVWALRHWRRGGQPASGSRDAVWYDQGRQTFFQALATMSLDILSRSLRRCSFYRATCALLALQFVVVWLWRLVLLKALALEWGFKGFFFLALALLGGKWATGTVTRILGLVASGGITSWFAEQSIMMEEMEQMQQAQGDLDDNDEDETSDAVQNMPEAYRAADASAYMSVLDMDEGIDDDFDDEEEVEGTFLGSPSSRQPQPRQQQGMGGSNVKAFLFSSMTVSFGSVAQCGLVGGLAQFVWSIIRNVDAAFSNQGRFQGMQIGSTALHSNSLFSKILSKVNTSARSFVRNRTDLAMSHVAAYFKHYRRAANDVFVLVETSGVEPIVHDDITTHMCACVCGSVSGLLVLLVGSLLSHHSNNMSDKAIVESMLLTFLLCYTMLFTVMEPLRASIKAVYICFAQHPQSLSQSFPLIFHRLSRISEATMV